jgi:hypothetical protein
MLTITMLIFLASPVSAADKVMFKGKPLDQSVSAEEKWYYPFEIGELKIKQSNDGSGIIKDVSCRGCDFKFVKITPETEVIVNGIKVDVLRARERAGKDAYIKFDKDTAEVKQIYWSEALSSAQ